MTRALPSTSVENSPSTALSAKAGAGSRVGRPSTSPMAAVTSAFVAGFGPVRFTGPLIVSLAMR